MIGKIFFEDKWRVCRFENNRLEILRIECEEPYGTSQISFIKNATIAFFEDGRFYYFDLTDIQLVSLNEFILSSILSPNYFVANEDRSHTIGDIKTFNYISFKNGVLKPMLERSSISPIRIDLYDISAEINFNVVQRQSDRLCEFETGQILSTNMDLYYEYTIDVQLDKAENISNLNKWVDSIYKFIEFVNIDFDAPIEKLQVGTNLGILDYYKNTVNYSNIVRRYNYVQNSSQIVENLLKETIQPNFNIKFLKSFKQDLTTIDYWEFSQSLEDNIKNRTPINIDEYKEVVEKHKKLKDKVESLDEFLAFDNEDRRFILAVIDNSKFRDKIMCALESYNNFAKNYSQYHCMSEKEMVQLSGQLSKARNSIHSGNVEGVDFDVAERCLRICFLGLYIYVLDKADATATIKFNMLSKIYRI